MANTPVVHPGRARGPGLVNVLVMANTPVGAPGPERGPGLVNVL